MEKINPAFLQHVNFGELFQKIQQQRNIEQFKGCNHQQGRWEDSG